jgi:hypothetical protein
MTSDPFGWVLHDGKAGMASQALGLAEAAGLPFAEKPLSIRPPWLWLPPLLWPAPLSAPGGGGARLEPPWPDFVVACGRNAAMPALAIRRASQGMTIAAQIQNPGVGRDEFDLMVVPAHDRRQGARIVVTRGAVHRVTPARLAAGCARFPGLAGLPRPIVAVLLGGTNKAYRLTLPRLGEIADALAAVLRRSGGSALVTPSRRTGAAGLRLVRDRLAGLPGAVWDGAGDNPYFAYLGFADAFLATADSVSMISEAAATGKPVHVLDLPGGNAKFAHFHQLMQQAGVTRPFRGDIEAWSYPILDDTARAGAALRALVLRRVDRQPRA